MWNEIKQNFLLSALAFAAVWLFVVIVFGDQIAAQPAPVQFVLVLASFALPALLIGRKLSDSFGGSVKKAVGLVAFGVSLDLLAPPLYLTTSGTLAKGGLFLAGSSDAVAYQLWSSTGLTGLPLFVLVYPVTFVLLLFLSAMLLSERDLVGLAKGGA